MSRRGRFPAFGLLLLVVLASFVLLGCSSGAKPTAKVPPTTISLTPTGPMTLPQAVVALASGGTIKLAEGTYRLEKPLAIAKSLTLVGAGLKTTEIECSAGGCVVEFGSDGHFIVEGITFRHIGVAKAETVRVSGGEVDFSHCQFSGAAGNSHWWSSGIWAKGSITGSVRNCVLSDNDVGIGLSGTANVMVEQNTCTSNKGAGITFDAQAAGIARDNLCNNNGFYGIAVWGNAHPTIDSNLAHGNRYGLIYYGRGSGIAEQNKFTSNSTDGIGIMGSARPRIESNTSARNDGDGISVVGTARPSVFDNIADHNKGVGIGAWGHAKAVIAGNQCNYNGTSEEGGICIGGHARPLVRDNNCQHNKNYGILYRDQAGGTCRGNYCSNSKYGILINMQAYPTLKGNTCEWNSVQDTDIYRG